MTGCSSDEPGNPDNGDSINPDTEVSDPTGTIALSMRNEDHGQTWLENLYIGDDNNFRTQYGDNHITSIGPVKGLGNVSSIPLTGWANAVAVEPEAGYVAYNPDRDEFIRIFVTDWVVATSGGIIGANVKYQKPFKGLDQEITCIDNVVFPSEGGQQQVIFDNTSIIPFNVTSSEPWCQVVKASTRDNYFLYDAIVISAEESYAATAQTAIVTIETLYGKKKEILVTRNPHGEFINLATSNHTFSNWSPEMQTATIDFYTNIDTKDITVSSSEDWLKGELADNTPRSTRSIRWIGKNISKAPLENPIESFILVSAQPNFANNKREGLITLEYGDISKTITVTQVGLSFELSETNLFFNATGELGKEILYSSPFHKENLQVDYEGNASDWCVAEIFDNSMMVTCKANPYPKSREGKIYIKYRNLDIVLATLNITQAGVKYDDVSIFFNRDASNESLIFTVPDNVKIPITSDASWVTATHSGQNLVIRATAATEDRFATINIGDYFKIYVSQSKYKVGDEYVEGSVKGMVYYMYKGLGYIINIKKLNEAKLYRWSTENVDLSSELSRTDGLSNMELIKGIPNWKELYPAFAYADSYNEQQNTTGWFLPTASQYLLGHHYTYIYEYDITTCSKYWTSYGSSSHKAQYVIQRGYSFRSSSEYGDYLESKQSHFRVMAMKSFSYDFRGK